MFGLRASIVFVSPAFVLICIVYQKMIVIKVSAVILFFKNCIARWEFFLINLIKDNIDLIQYHAFVIYIMYVCVGYIIVP